MPPQSSYRGNLNIEDPAKHFRNVCWNNQSDAMDKMPTIGRTMSGILKCLCGLFSSDRKPICCVL